MAAVTAVVLTPLPNTWKGRHVWTQPTPSTACTVCDECAYCMGVEIITKSLQIWSRKHLLELWLPSTSLPEWWGARTLLTPPPAMGLCISTVR